MALKDWPARIRYTWTDPTTGTPYGLVFDDPASAISFIITQRNNLDTADDLLASLSDADTGQSLADDSHPAKASDIQDAAPAGVVLPEPEPEETPDPEIPENEPSNVDTTATASPVAAANTGTSLPDPSVTPTATVPDVQPAPADPTVDPSTPTDAPASADDSGSAPASFAIPAASSPDASAPSDTETSAPATLAPAGEVDDEDTDFDSPASEDTETDRVADDGPVDPSSAPSIGTPTADTPGVTGV